MLNRGSYLTFAQELGESQPSARVRPVEEVRQSKAFAPMEFASRQVRSQSVISSKSFTYLSARETQLVLGL
jgi:hypothetical protein